MEVTLDSKMELNASAFKPAPTAPGKFWRLGHLGHSKQTSIKNASLLFPAWRHSQLNVVDGSERCFQHKDMLAETRNN